MSNAAETIWTGDAAQGHVEEVKPEAARAIRDIKVVPSTVIPGTDEIADPGGLIAVCEDGSLWFLCNKPKTQWQRLPDIPQDNI